MANQEQVALEGGPHNGGTAQAKPDQHEITIGSPSGPHYQRTDRQTKEGKPIFTYVPEN
jgi:hypothetical protein